jgi:hypothetical protein
MDLQPRIGIGADMARIIFLGDVYLGEPAKIAVPFSGDVILNLEGPITDAEQPFPGKINLKSPKVHFDLSLLWIIVKRV